MALIVAGLGALAAAGTGAYAASQAGAQASASNKMQGQALADNRRATGQQQLMDALTFMMNSRQQALDNGRYDDAKKIEDIQRAFTNKLATASQTTPDGATLSYDPLSGGWSTQLRGLSRVNADRRTGLESDQYQQALVSQLVGGQQNIDKRVQGGHTQAIERALGEKMLGQYAANPGRSRESMEGAQIEANVANASDPIQRGGGMAMLQGWRQGNSGSDALMGSLARQSGAGTRSAIAQARLNAPVGAANEQDAVAKSLLGPANTLTSRGNAGSDLPSPVFSGDTSSNLLAAVQRNNPAGVGTTLNPRSAGTGFGPNRNQQTAFTPLNADGISGAGYGAVAKTFADSNFSKALGQQLTDWWNKPKSYADNAPAGYTDRGFQDGDYPTLR